jgi:hypothetical protein
MTLKPYDASALDEFALRLLDLASIMRAMAKTSREYGIEDFCLHDKKAREWCQNLERWIRKSEAELQMMVIEARGRRRALAGAE